MVDDSGLYFDSVFLFCIDFLIIETVFIDFVSNECVWDNQRHSSSIPSVVYFLGFVLYLHLFVGLVPLSVCCVL